MLCICKISMLPGRVFHSFEWYQDLVSGWDRMYELGCVGRPMEVHQFM